MGLISMESANLQKVQELKIRETSIRGISGITHRVKCIEDNDCNYLYVELDNPKVEDFIKAIVIATDTELKPYIVVKKGKVLREWENEIARLGGKIVHHCKN